MFHFQKTSIVLNNLVKITITFNIWQDLQVKFKQLLKHYLPNSCCIGEFIDVFCNVFRKYLLLAYHPSWVVAKSSLFRFLLLFFIFSILRAQVVNIPFEEGVKQFGVADLYKED